MTVEEENVQKEYVKQRQEELRTYIDGLFDTVQVKIKASNRFAKLDLATFLLFLLTMFVGPDSAHEWAETLLYGQLLFGHIFIHSRVVFTFKEIDGCFNTLEILGMLVREEDNDDDRKKRRVKMKRESWIAKMWEALKSKQQQEAYA